MDSGPSLRLSVALVALAAFLVYAPSLGGEFVYDDRVLVVENENIHSLARPGRFFTDPDTLSSHGALHSYRPLRTLLFAAEWQVFGDRPLGWRLVSALLHAGVAALLLGLLRRWTGRPRGALFAALLFAVHPIATECVPWVSIQGDLIMVGALLAAFLALDDPRPSRTVAGAALFLMAAGFKEAAVVFPVLLLVRILARPPEAAVRRRWAMALVAVVVLAGLYTLLRQHMVTSVVGEAAAHRPWYGGGWWATVGAFLAAVVYYAGSLVSPVQLTIRWAPYAPPAGAGEWMLLGAGAILLAVALAIGIRAVRRRSLAGAGLLMALVTLGPASSILVPLPTVSEVRYLYPALAFLCLALVPWLDRVKIVPAVLLPLLLAMLTVQRSCEWRSDEALWTAALGRPRSTPEALLNVGAIRLDRGWRALDEGRVEPARTDLLSAADLLGDYSAIRLRHAHLVLPPERAQLDRFLTGCAVGLLRVGRPDAAVRPAALAVDFGGISRERLGLLAEALRASGHENDARRVEDDIRRLR